MNGSDFLPVAHVLLTGATEAFWRSAVSRAYYGAFHVARQLLEDLGFTVPQGDRAHAYLWLRLSNCGHVLVVEAGRSLNELRRRRNRADYDLKRPFSQPTAVSQVQAAERIILLLGAAPIEPTRTQITDVMKIYEKDTLKEITWHP